MLPTFSSLKEVEICLQRLNHAYPLRVTGAMCVQRFDDSLNPAIHTTYRISLRSSSLREPRYPSAGVVCWLLTEDTRHRRAHSKRRRAPTRERPERDPRRLGGARARARNDGRRQEGGAPTEEATTAPRTPPRGEGEGATPPPPRDRRALEERAETRKQYARCGVERPVMILPQVHLRKPCYDFSFL